MFIILLFSDSHFITFDFLNGVLAAQISSDIKYLYTFSDKNIIIYIISVHGGY